ncbi:MAG: hypothetical protein IKP68_00970 [Clostridia bacterium]|nr:hypothetical protein [Clostridia bacterium]
MKKQIRIERFDSLFGVVIKVTMRGVFMKLENGLIGFSYTSLRIGDRVFCSVKKEYKKGRFYYLDD